ncbi:MAG: SLBB domain-containing protein [Actinomycetota bacterium]
MESGALQRWAESARASRSELGLLALLGLAVVGAGLVVILRTSDPPAPPVRREAAVDARPSLQPSAQPSPQVFKVHVAGQVAHPGVYTLIEGSRVDDAVAAAGGPLQGADGNSLNLAAPVVDGQKILLLKPGEAVPPEQPAFQGPDGGGGPGVGPGKMNINLASQKQLEELPGVGPVLAERIIAFRQNRKFSSPRQLL